MQPAERRPNGKPYRSTAMAILGLLVTYAVLAYVVFPLAWLGYADLHPALRDSPHLTVTSDGHPGDPINVGLIGNQSELMRIMQAAQWYPADPLGLRSDLKIAADTVLKRSYAEAPVSNLYLFGRKEDLAFEKPVGDDPRQRHHVRFWKSTALDNQGRPLWFGSATYDQRVGLSHTTGQVTHHIDADIDAERDRLFGDLIATNELDSPTFVDDFHRICNGHNGGGDRWQTDGRLRLGTIRGERSGAGISRNAATSN